MSWWGKLLGGTVGFMLGGPLGALIGAVLGHNVDAGLKRAAGGSGEFLGQERTQTAFFTATFSVMGHLAKADGRVSEDEIRLASGLMDHMALSGELKTLAKRLFDQGKQPDFPLDDVLAQFRRECHRSRNLLRMFLEIQTQAAYADGEVHSEERRILRHLCTELGLPEHELEQIEALLKAHTQGIRSDRKSSLSEAYAVLGVGRDATDADVKKAYRRLMSQHHPDKLVAKGLPEEMMALATEKTQEIKAAYETVMTARK